MGEGASRAQGRFAAAVALAVLMGALVWVAPAGAAGPYLEGIDVSRWQGKPVWSEVKAAGVRFVIAKATDGTTWVDPEYARNRARLRGNRIPFSAYHFARPDLSAGDAVAEADHFVSTARLDRSNLLPVLDLETNANGMTAQQLREWAAAWLARVHERLGVKALIYTDRYFWIEQMADTTWFADRGYPLWIAHWTTAAEPTLPAQGWGGRGWTLWQYAVEGGLPGINGRVDRDRYRGETLAPLRIRNNR